MPRRGRSNRNEFTPREVRRGRSTEVLRNAFSEFLLLPTLLTLVVLGLGMLAYVADIVRLEWLEPLRDTIQSPFWRTSEITTNMVTVLTSTIITITSIILPLLLLSVQQSGSLLSGSVVDQFLARKANQACFGFFIATGLYALLLSSLLDPDFNPVWAATLLLIEAAIAVCLLLVLLYATLDQMRPIEVAEEIRDATVAARARQLDEIVRRTRRKPSSRGGERVVIRTSRTGYVRDIDLDRLQGAIDASGAPAEVVLKVAIGDYVAYGDALAEVRVPEASGTGAAEAVGDALEAAIQRGRRRTIGHVDPEYGVEQLADIGWGSISGGKDTPLVGRIVVTNLRDILLRTSLDHASSPDGRPLDIVYADGFPDDLMDTFESLAVVSAESSQHQSYAEVLRALADAMDRLPESYAERAIGVIRRILPLLEAHTSTRRLQHALHDVAEALEREGLVRVAEEARRRRRQLLPVEPEDDGAGADPRTP